MKKNKLFYYLLLFMHFEMCWFEEEEKNKNKNKKSKRIKLS